MPNVLGPSKFQRVWTYVDAQSPEGGGQRGHAGSRSGKDGRAGIRHGSTCANSIARGLWWKEAKAIGDHTSVTC
jgi:hypothetical protein